jgi:polyisoprenoid-binding protein YceI
MSGDDRGLPTALLLDGAAVGSWRLDAQQSHVAFAVKHLWGLMTVRGTFGDVRGEATVDAAGAISVSITVDASSVDTKQGRRDEHLRSADFFDVASDPTMTFVSTEVSPRTDGTLDVTGVLTLLGHARPIDTVVALSDASPESAIAVTDLAIDRTLFGITRGPMRMASADVLVSVRLFFEKR